MPNQGSSLCSQIHAALHQAILQLCREIGQQSEQTAFDILDVGCWTGERTTEYGRALGRDRPTHLHGIEIFDDIIGKARLNGLEVAKVDLEREPFPYESGKFDLVICNQVFEHLKQVFNPMDEILRVIKPGGFLIFSVPNLASFHNRLMLLMGLQPSSIRIFGPHVRGFTAKAFVEFATHHDHFALRKFISVGFYPFPAKFPGNSIARLWPYACHTPVLLLQKNAIPTQGPSAGWNHDIESQSTQTLF